MSRLFAEYQTAKRVTEREIARREHASVALELARVRERLAEINNQHDPIAKIIGCEQMGERDRIRAIAFYVVMGRAPAEWRDAFKGDK